MRRLALAVLLSFVMLMVSCADLVSSGQFPEPGPTSTATPTPDVGGTGIPGGGVDDGAPETEPPPITG